MGYVLCTYTIGNRFTLWNNYLSYSCERRASHILPSFLKRNQISSRPKKAKKISTWNRDIICLPQSRRNSADNSFAYPRGRYRAYLGKLGLIGKLHISSDMNEDDVKGEIRSVFKGPMGNDPNFPFLYLQSAGEGSKTLVMPSVSSTFCWTAQQVARLAGQRSTIYVLAQADIPNVEDEVSELSFRF